VVVRNGVPSSSKESWGLRGLDITADAKWSGLEVLRGFSERLQGGRLMVVFVLEGSLFLFVPLDPGQ
jgi:hypothetical protein